jgi:hypothetical protein
MKERYMKLFITLFAALLALTIVSCGDESTKSPVDNDTAVTDDTIVDDTVTDDAVETGDDAATTEEDPAQDDVVPVEDDATIVPDETTDEIIDEDSAQPDDTNPLFDIFVGSWAEKVVLRSDTKTMIGNVSSTTTRYKLGKVTIENGELRSEQTICKIDNTTSQGDTVFYQKFCEIYWFWRPGELMTPKPDVTVTDNGGTITFVENRSWELRGMQKMPNVETDTMPTAGDDVRIFDHDADGHPAFTLGFTSTLIKGDMYLVQRLSHEMTGTYIPGDGQYTGSNNPDSIEGGVNWTDHQYTVDATNATLKGQKESTILNDESTFIYVRVADTFTCDDVYGQKDALFK